MKNLMTVAILCLVFLAGCKEEHNYQRVNDGAQGPQGQQGAQGPQGAQGAQGPAGPGSTVNVISVSKSCTQVASGYYAAVFTSGGATSMTIYSNSNCSTSVCTMSNLDVSSDTCWINNYLFMGNFVSSSSVTVHRITYPSVTTGP